MRLSFTGREVTIDDQTWRVPFPIRHALLIADRVVVLYDYMAGPHNRQFRNLEAYTVDGARLWTAEHPTATIADAYVKITGPSPLKAYSFSGYDCIVDLSNGKLLDALFTK